MWWGMGWPLVVKSSPWLTASKNTATPALQLQGPEFYQQPDLVESFPELLDKNLSHQHFDFILVG